MLKSRLLSGFAWNSVSTGAAQGCSFLRLTIVAAAVGPGGIGQFAIASSVLAAVMILGEFGFKQMYIANRIPAVHGSSENPLEENLGTVWFANMMLRGMLVILAAVMGAASSVVLNAPGTGSLVVALAASALLVALSNPQLLEDERQGRFRRIAIAESVGQVTGLAVAVWVLGYTHSVWVLVIGQLVASCVTVCTSYLVVKRPRRLKLNRPLLMALLPRGRPFLAISATTYATYTLDKLILATFFPLATVGVYFLAQRLVEVPATMYSLIAGRAALPFYATRADAGGLNALWRALKTMLGYALAFYVAIASIVLAGAALFGTSWVPSEWSQGFGLLPLLLAGVAARTGCHVLSPALIVLGKVSVDAKLKLLETTLYLLFLPLAVSFAGAHGAALVFSAIYVFSLYRRYSAIRVASVGA